MDPRRKIARALCALRFSGSGGVHARGRWFCRVAYLALARARAVLAVAPATWPGRVILIDLSSEEDHPLVELLPPR